MRVVHRIHFWFLFAMFSILALAATTRAQEPRYPKPTELPNPYRLVKGLPTLPKTLQNTYFNASCRIRGSAADRIKPKVAVVLRLVAGLRALRWFGRLNASARNSTD
jgi:hypothetical protein